MEPCLTGPCRHVALDTKVIGQHYGEFLSSNADEGDPTIIDYHGNRCIFLFSFFFENLKDDSVFPIL